jgi:hypothetical protein
MAQLRSKIDFSRVSEAHPLYDTSLRNNLGSCKLTELNIVEVVSIKRRLFSYITKCELSNVNLVKSSLEERLELLV